MINWGKVPLASVLPFIFDSFDGGTGASITLTGLAVADIFVYKGTSMTQRASTAGFVLLETDGIDLDTNTGIHGFSIDTGDNTDAGFFVAGSFYTVVVASVTIDAQTVNFVAGTFWLGPTLTIAGVDEVDVTHVAGTAQTAGDLKASLNTIDGQTSQLSFTAATYVKADVTAISTDTVAADRLETMLDGTGGNTLTAGIVGDITGSLSGSIGSLGTTAKNDVNAEVDTALADINLDHIAGTATAIPAIPAGTYIDQMMDDGTAVYDRTTDSLQAIRDTAPLGTAMRGTDSAALASVCTEARLAILSGALTESYAADGVAPTLTQALFQLLSALTEFSISGTTITCKKLDGLTTSMTFTLDDGTNPTSRTRST